MPVVLVVGPTNVGKTTVSAAVLIDAAKHRKMRVLAIVPSAPSFRLALQKVSGTKPGDPLPDGCDVVEVQEEVSGGCVCCTVRRDIEDVLADLLGKHRDRGGHVTEGVDADPEVTVRRPDWLAFGGRKRPEADRI